jgi:SAM-dependent methyltransferase
VGDRLSLYRTLAAGGSLTPEELASRCGLSERYVREWLEHQAVAKVLAAEESSAGRRFSLPEAHAEVLTDGESLAFMAPLAQGVVALARTLSRVLQAFHTGSGVSFDESGEDIRWFISRINRPMFLNLLASEWFPQVPGLVERLQADPPARVVEVGCGTGWSAIAIARAFPKVEVVGLDLDEGSIQEARENAATAGVTSRLSFECRDAADPALGGRFDLVCAFETIHGMCDPVGALRAMRALRSEAGTVLVADERVADEFTTEVEDGERFQWGWSALHCLPTALTTPPTAGTGTIMRAPVLRRYSQQAGFADLEVLPIENDFWRFYRLTG